MIVRFYASALFCGIVYKFDYVYLALQKIEDRPTLRENWGGSS